MRGITGAALRRIAEMLDDEMKRHFVERTERHIALVQKYCRLLEDAWDGLDGLIERGEEHDAGKFDEPELDPYVWLTWRYKCQDDGVECQLPEGMDDAIKAATQHHILNNPHHPEYHQLETLDVLNEEDRDGPAERPIDGSGMGVLDIAEMVADWMATSEERGNTPRGWAEENMGVRWVFTPEQEDLIYALIDSVWLDKKSAQALVDTQEPDEEEHIPWMDSPYPETQSCTVYRFGKTVQVVWADGKTETWHAHTEEDAHDNFIDVVERWSTP